MLWVTNTMVYKRLSSWHSSSMCCVPAGSSDAVGSSSSRDRKSTRLNSSHSQISYAVFCLKKKKAQSELVLFLMGFGYGETLLDQVAWDGPLPPSVAIKLLHEVARALRVALRPLIIVTHG